MIKLGENLKKEMQKRKLTIKKLSEMSGVSVGSISEITTGKENNPKLMTVINISDALNIPLKDLLGA
ncbi:MULTISPECIES: helix-turn-helix domain-containing protein [Clostridium]|jgi:transcriptional regulator with XRE-family HTH domain|uniref:Putative transcriptional regulator n=1 Tax=Clostridium disporicum TaxID=84024 RepID=A0A174DH26_9CLOT|nr:MULTISPECIES: helix-turn-helix transcriptional regulator [Clostridium]CUO24734.1 putative transcriptional regulator [Clostridium disporicum]